jgi:hypothetical protein
VTSLWDANAYQPLYGVVALLLIAAVIFLVVGLSSRPERRR